LLKGGTEADAEAAIDGEQGRSNMRRAAAKGGRRMLEASRQTARAGFHRPQGCLRS
jgi:hypothetical protein